MWSFDEDTMNGFTIYKDGIERYGICLSEGENTEADRKNMQIIVDALRTAEAD